MIRRRKMTMGPAFVLTALVSFAPSANANGGCNQLERKEELGYCREYMALEEIGKNMMKAYCARNPDECVDISEELWRLVKKVERMGAEIGGEILETCPDAVVPCTTGQSVSCKVEVLICALKPTPAY